MTFSQILISFICKLSLLNRNNNADSGKEEKSELLQIRLEYLVTILLQ